MRCDLCQHCNKTRLAHSRPSRLARDHAYQGSLDLTPRRSHFNPWGTASRRRSNDILLSANQARDRKDWTNAAQKYREYLAREPEHFEIWVQLGHALKELGQPSEALSSYSSALSLRNDDADLLLNIGHLYKLLNLVQEAKNYFRKSYNIDRNPSARRELNSLGEYTELSSSFDAASAPRFVFDQHHPSTHNAFLNLAKHIENRRAAALLTTADLARNERDWPAAARSYQLYLKHRPHHAAIWVQLGHSLKEIGQIERAVQAYGEALILNSGLSDTLLHLGHAYKLLNDGTRAQFFYSESAKIDANPSARSEINSGFVLRTEADPSTTRADHRPAMSSDRPTVDAPLHQTANTEPVGPCVYGEEPPKKPLLVSSAFSRSRGQFQPISIVLPTYNRSSLLRETLEICAARRGGVELEFVVIDDGSTDNTAAVLSELSEKIEHLVWRTIPNGGPGQARNLGVSLATHEVVLFLGDDLQPLNDDFFETHARLHSIHPSNRFAVLGKCIWPEHKNHSVNFTMAHIQGHGGEQFGYADLTPHSFIDYRFFYTANVSLKKSVISDWIADGFKKEFTFAAYEDAELAYRLSKQTGGFAIYYDPTSVGGHIHPYTVDSFISRQLAAGMMAHTFEDLHPEIDVVPKELRYILRSPELDERMMSDYLATIEGIKSWAKILDANGTLGREGWHDDLLFGVFELSYLQGYLLAEDRLDTNLAAGYKFVIANSLQRFRRIIHHELAGHQYMQDTLLSLS